MTVLSLRRQELSAGLAFEDASPGSPPDTMDTAYVSGNVIPVLFGGGFDLYAIASGSTDDTNAVTFTAGDLLTSNGDGTLKLSTLAVAVTQSGETPFAVSAATMPAHARRKSTGNNYDRKINCWCRTHGTYSR